MMPRPTPTLRGRILIFSLLAALLVGLTVSPRSARADAALDAYNTAVGLHKDKRYQAAADAFRGFLKEHPQHEKAPYAELYLGLTLVNLEKYAEARSTLRSFVKGNPTNRNLPDAMYRIAECSYLLNDFAAAESEFAAFAAAYPKNELMEWAVPYLAEAQLRQKKYDDAAASFRKSLELFPKGRMAGESKYGLARAYEATKKDAEAIALYSELAADESNPRAAQAQSGLAARLYDSGKFNEAADAYLKLIERFPQNALVPSARLNAGFAYYRMEKFREAAAQLDLAAKDESQKASALYWSGMSRQALGDQAAAAGLFQSVFDLAPAGPYAERALHQWANAELATGKLDSARDRFLDVVKRFPKGDYAAESLLRAAETSLRLDKAPDAQAIGQRLKQEYPDSPFHLHVQLLEARIVEARGDETGRKEAAARFAAILKENGDPRVQTLARLHLTRLQQKAGAHDEALATIGPVLEQLRTQDDSKSEFADAFVLAGASLLATRQHDKAVQTATDYLAAFPAGEQADQALSLRAAAEMRRGRTEPALADLERLRKDFPKSPLVGQTLFDIAEGAYARKEYELAGRLFEQLATSDAAGSLKGAGLSGLAWSEYERGKHREAAVHFGEVLRTYSDDKVRAPEAGFMQGLSLQKAGEGQPAAEAFAAAFEKLAPESAAPGSEVRGGPHYFAFHAGLEGARGWRKLGKRTEADALYKALSERFPEAKDRDLLIDEWALMHYEGEDFTRADELFRRLVKEYPESARADDARLNLAESAYASRRLDEARREFAALSEATTSDDSVRQRSLFNLARVAAEQRDWKEVQAAAAKSLPKDGAAGDPPTGDRGHLEALLGEAQLNLGDAKGAKETLGRLYAFDALAKEPWFAQVRTLLAEANLQLKDYDAVQAIVLDYRKNEPESPVLHRAEEVLGRAYKNQAKFAEARDQFDRVVNDKHAYRTETAAKCQFLLGETYMMQQNYKSALTEYYKVEKLYKFPEWQSTALFQAAKCNEALNRWKDAVTDYEELMKKYPETKIMADAKQQLDAARKRARGR